MNRFKNIYEKICKRKILLLLGTAFVVFCLTAIFITVNKISPKEIRAMAMEHLQKTFPSADITLGKIDLSLGVTVKLRLSSLSVVLKQTGRELFSVKDSSIHIPLRAVLFGGGAVEAVFLRPNFFYREIKNSNNWALAMKSSSKKPTQKIIPLKDPKKANDDSFTVMIPGALGRIKLNFKFVDVDLNYSLKNNQKGDIKFSRFLIKDINFNEKTAFEMASRMNFNFDKKNFLALDVLIIGEFNLAEVFKNERFSSFIVVKLENFKSKGIPLRPSEIRAEINLTADKKGKISAALLANFSGKSKFKADFKLDLDKIKISDISTDIYLEDILSTVEMKKYSLNPGKARLNLTGSIVINSTDNFKVNPKLKFALTPGLVYDVSDLSVKTSMKGGLFKKRLLMNFKNQLAEGNLGITVKGKIDLDRKFTLKKLKPLSVKMNLNNLVLKENLVKKFLYNSKKTRPLKLVSNNKKSKKTIQEKKRKPSFIPAKIDIDWKNIKLGREILSGSGVVILSAQAITTPKMSFRLLKGRVNLTHKSEYSKTSDKHSFQLKMKKLDISRINDFFPPPLEKIEGRLNGILTGKMIFPQDGPMKYNMKTDLTAQNGSVHGLKLGKRLDKFIAKLEKVPGLKGKINKDKKYNLDTFKTLKVKGHFSSKTYRFDEIFYVESKNKLKMDMNGAVYPPMVKKQGRLNLNFSSKIAGISKIIKKQTNLNSIPVRLKGMGFDLEPDYSYTVRKLATAMAKNTAKKGIKKLGDKLLKGKSKNKIKELLKGFL